MRHIVGTLIRACLCTCVVGGTPLWAGVIYVDAAATGSNDGSSWPNACKYLQDALAAAATAEKPVEIRVATGIYKPDRGARITLGDRAVTFDLLNGVTLKGGYAGVAAPDPNARDISLYETILSGDLAGDNGDGNDRRYTHDDSCCVIKGRQVDGTAVMDGLTVVGRPWVGGPCSVPSDESACIVVDGGSPAIRECRFRGNRARMEEPLIRVRNAGAPTFVGCVFSDNDILMYVTAGKPTFLDCLFTGNRHEGVGCYAKSTASFTNCRFESNQTGVTGGSGSSLTVSECTFVDNAAAVKVEYSSTLIATRCLYQRNKQGIYGSGSSVTASDCRFEGSTHSAVDSTGDAVLIRCTFTGNFCRFPVYSFGNLTAANCTFTANAGLTAGAIQSHGVTTLRNCEFIGNSAEEITGGIWASGDIFRATGCLFTGNSGKQGGVISISGTVFSLSNCTFADNRGTPNAIRYHKSGRAYPAVITGCILRNGPAALLDESPSNDPVAIAYSNVQGGYEGQGNIDADPCFVSSGYWADPNNSSIILGPEDSNAVWVPGDYHLKSQAGHWDRATQTWVCDESTSVCIDAGDPNSPVSAEPFPNGGFINMGTYAGTAEASRTYFGGPVCETQIAGDINGDCVVNDTDMEILTSHWLQQGWPVTDLPPTITITQPKDGDELGAAKPVSIRVDASDPDGTVIRVGFLIKHESATSYQSLSATDIDPSNGWGYEWQWSARGRTPEALETWTIQAEALDDGGNIAVSPEIQVKVRVNQ